MNAIRQNLKIIDDAGYTQLGNFTLPDSAWWEAYYQPIEQRLTTMREKYAGNKPALEVLENEQREIDLFRKHSDSYGYVFYVMQYQSE